MAIRFDINTVPASNDVLTWDTTLRAYTPTAVTSAGGAPSNATYVTLSTNATLTVERVLTGTANQITLTDNGAGSTSFYIFQGTNIAGSDVSTYRLAVDNAGNVGIGTGASAIEALLEIQATEGADATLCLDADDGDDNADTWFIKSVASDNDLDFVNHTTVVFGLNSVGKANTYSSVATTGWGVPAIYGSGRATAQTATNASIATYTVGAAEGSFMVSGNVQVTTSTTHSFSLDVTYTDETSTARTLILPMAQLAGSFVSGGLITNITGAGPYESPVMHIRCKAATAITIRTSSGGTYTTVEYNAEGTIVQIA